jgi:hypothetical protein
MAIKRSDHELRARIQYLDTLIAKWDQEDVVRRCVAALMRQGKFPDEGSALLAPEPAPKPRKPREERELTWTEEMEKMGIRPKTIKP